MEVVIGMAEYIDRESLKQRFRLRMDWLKKDIHDEYSGALFDGCESDIELIDEIPADDVAPVRHGRWYDKGSLSCRCSECGCKSNRENNYCPNCGCKMDLEG